MDNFTMIDVAAARLGAACLDARSPWTNVAGTGADHALGQAAVMPITAARVTNAQLIGTQSAQRTQRTQSAAFPAAGLHPMTDLSTTLLPMTENVVRELKTVHKTRINAGGYGAMGPHPERERLAS